ncbi:hypothetical protein NP493_17g04014 [Ridgeia piscesae]|uniref:SOCS box domain-containing protein n=1 Tax=Ridgeia piscesae TaxID=27915 RepID=A0AAD9PEI7_RIDPI|nr:hypothetical protein NP493_17g04014 [Ridgeia piscesae]
MGNSISTRKQFRSTIRSSDNPAALRRLLETERAKRKLNVRINRKGDTALIYCIRREKYQHVPALIAAGCDITACNKDGLTALEMLLSKVVPSNGFILHQHFCPFPFDTPDFELPEILKTLLKAGACADSMQRLLLLVARQPRTVRELITLISDIHRPELFRISGLLLQLTVWFDQLENLELLFERGVDIENFWHAPFVPKVVPACSDCSRPRSRRRWVLGKHGAGHEYSLDDPDEDESTQGLKYSFWREWIEGWDEEYDPRLVDEEDDAGDAQFKASLLLTPIGAIAFCRACNSRRVLAAVVRHILHYRPVACGGPDLSHCDVARYLAAAGYDFHADEVHRLRSKCRIDFGDYDGCRSRPRSLKQLSRIAVRFRLRANVLSGVERLDDVIPPELRDYIAMVDRPSWW